ncbi:toxin CcdB [Variovorax paradoxus]|jgi:toxin CcdB|uniref:CcdB family protein n=1 Tax=Variovorax atrisoli TaxID=3394203 RepID=UPI00119B243C|nr:CcdB family protein [Variovorax paradoxus]MDR6521015.1 toxin CcdB [Variovorax paradoxus]
MTQFDVYANPSKTQRGEIPWMVDIQSEILDKLPTRLVMPLALRANMPAAMPRSLCPTIGWNGATLVALPHLAAPFRVKDLGAVQGNLRSQASDFVAALDAVISGI